jgi:hypothetical protein
MAPPPNLDELLNTRIFPGMTAPESRLIRAFLQVQGRTWDTASVTTRVGQGVILPPHITDQKAREDWERRTKARPDLVLQSGPRVAIVEAKEQATNEAIWQVLGYRDLYVAEHPGVTVQPIVVCEAATPTAVELARGQKVQMFTYEFAAPAGLEATESEA